MTVSQARKARATTLTIKSLDNNLISTLPSEGLATAPGDAAAITEPTSIQNTQDDVVFIQEDDVPYSRRPKRVRVGKKKRKRRVRYPLLVAPRRDPTISFQIDHLREFQSRQNVILDELLRHEGIGHLDPSAPCATCGAETSNIRCIDCVALQLECAVCICKRHAQEPFHRLRRWNGICYVPYSLFDAGLSVQLGHDGLSCPHPHASPTTITAIDILGIHKVQVVFCDCQLVGSAPAYIQLLRANWWPVTLERPRTVVTIRTLKFFHALSVQAKTNAYDFYNGIVRFTDGSGLHQLKSRYQEFTRATRCYRHLEMTKRGGRGHDPGGIESTQEGSLAVECPACPHPGRNLPEGWESAPAHRKFLYALLLAVDANFKLKLKSHSYLDIELAPGWSYFVPEGPYQQHLASNEDEEEMKTCDSTFAAVDHANTPGQKRFSINGVGAVVCARHAFFRPNAVGDLPRGERYVFMGFLLLMTISIAGVLWKMLVISYDIACQFSKNFQKRMSTFPPSFRISPVATSVTFLVPKFHLPAHGPRCQADFSFNNTEGVGRTYGEGIEANWSKTNRAALSSREMSAGARHESLNDIFGAINWGKIVSMGTLFHRSLKEAVYMLAEQDARYKDLKETFPPAVIERWDQMIMAWDADKSQPNPYDEPVQETTLADVRLEISTEEAREASQGVVSLHEMTSGTFLSVGLDLQDQQRRLLQKKGNKGTDQITTKKKVTLQDKRNALHHRIQAWRQVQVLYMPIVSTLLPKTNADDSRPQEPAAQPDADEFGVPKPEYEKLWMPSDLKPSLWATGIYTGLAQKELRLREAEAEDALHEIRRLIRIHLGLRHYKKTQVDGPGQKRNTRTREIITEFLAKRDHQFERYNAARSALDKLQPDPDASWRVRLLPMTKTDLVDPSGNDGEDEDCYPNQRSKKALEQRRQKALGEGRKEVPWIWRTLQPDARDLPRSEEMTEDEVHESMRVTYAKTRARARRWKEEIELLTEEMRRTLVFLQWKEKWWYAKLEARLDAPPDIRSGLRAYAMRQCLIFNGIAMSFKTLWDPLCKDSHLHTQFPDIIQCLYPSEAQSAPLSSMNDNLESDESDESGDEQCDDPGDDTDEDFVED
ncbi:hypothetical protein DENSPDRAFT_788366 [Dentipellis sp. KUC8613]|nr:hypothetical protein DENSPDRAFT_788366 [Dentipellis sp. KUC8613]